MPKEIQRNEIIIQTTDKTETKFIIYDTKFNNPILNKLFFVSPNKNIIEIPENMIK